MRVIAGEFKGRRLVTPRGLGTRPTSDQVRIALLDTLTPWLADARLLDLFAGAGGVGLEALSRGAAHVTFVERDAQAVAALRRNIATLGVEARARVLGVDVGRALDRLAREAQRFRLVFLDPPYDTELSAVTLQRLGGGDVTDPSAVVIAQHRTKQPPAEHIGTLAAFRARRFGETTLTFFRAGEYSSRAPDAPD